MKKNFLMLLLFVILFSIIFFTLILFEICFPKKIENKMVEIKVGESAKVISEKLQKEGIIKNKNLFLMLLKYLNCQNKLQPGKYEFNNYFSLLDVIKKIVKGERVKITITIKEGWTRKDIANLIEKETTFSKNEFLEKTKDKEGYLFPDTYEILPGETLDDLLSKIEKNFEKNVAKIKKEVGEEKFKEILILASILEKEVKTKEDKEIVAGILLKRLQERWYLQVDSTIGYILDKKEITAEDLKIDSPYNTYKYKGLPPTPISNPGLESILAVLYHKDSDYWYYLSLPNGTTIYSKTLNEHNLAIEKYLK